MTEHILKWRRPVFIAEEFQLTNVQKTRKSSLVAYSNNCFHKNHQLMLKLKGKTLSRNRVCFCTQMFAKVKK